MYKEKAYNINEWKRYVKIEKVHLVQIKSLLNIIEKSNVCISKYESTNTRDIT